MHWVCLGALSMFGCVGYVWVRWVCLGALGVFGCVDSLRSAMFKIRVFAIICLFYFATETIQRELRRLTL